MKSGAPITGIVSFDLRLSIDDITFPLARRAKNYVILIFKLTLNVPIVFRAKNTFW
jgi:hypothetical protein